MALVECPECGGQVSTLAAACPHCGFPVSGTGGETQRRPRGPSRWTDPGFWVIVIGLAAVIAVSILLLRQAARQDESDSTSPATTSQAVMFVPADGGWGVAAA